MKNEAKNKKDKAIVTIKATNDTEPPVVEYTAIKRMLGTLDRFLTKRFMLVVGLCTAVISGCIVGLMIENRTFGHAFSLGRGAGTSGGSLTATIWLGSIIAVAVFIIILTIVYNLRKRKRTALRSEEA